MRDLFDIFPDLPHPPRRPLSQRLEELRRRADEVRGRFIAETAKRRVIAQRVQEHWRKKFGR